MLAVTCDRLSVTFPLQGYISWEHSQLGTHRHSLLFDTWTEREESHALSVENLCSVGDRDQTVLH
jgi:hypothetical protein